MRPPFPSLALVVCVAAAGAGPRGVAGTDFQLRARFIATIKDRSRWARLDTSLSEPARGDLQLRLKEESANVSPLLDLIERYPRSTLALNAIDTINSRG